MDFALPPGLNDFIKRLDMFIDQIIAPLQASSDNERFFDHRREHSRTDWDNQGLPREEWELLLGQAVKLADGAGFWRLALPAEYGGKLGGEVGKGNLWMAAIRLHLARKGLGLFNDLQNEYAHVTLVSRIGAVDRVIETNLEIESGLDMQDARVVLKFTKEPQWQLNFRNLNKCLPNHRS